MPVILPIWEAEIWRIAVLGQPWRKKFVRLHLNRAVLRGEFGWIMGVMWCACHHSNRRKLEIGERPFKLLGQKVRPCSKIIRAERVGSVLKW
jgi:hypothetical protein